MATKTWTGALSTDWNDPGNWSPPGVPGSGDDVVIGTTGNSPALNTSTTVDLLTINGTDTLTLSGAGTVLTATLAIVLSSTGGISGTGKIAASVTVTDAAHIIASGGALEVTGSITASAGTPFLAALTINGANDTLVLDGVTTAHALSFNDSSGTLEIGSAGRLTTDTTIEIGSGTVQLDGPSSSVGAELTISTGTISGSGKVGGRITATGAAHITATGGTLEVDGFLTDDGHALVLTIASSTDRLLLNVNGGAHAVSFNGASGTLEIGRPSFGTGTVITVGTGTVLLDFSDSILFGPGLTLGGGMLKGLGFVNEDISGTGTVIASGGTLHLTGSVGGGLILAIASGSVLSIESTAVAAAPIIIDSSSKTLAIGSGGDLTINGGAESITNGTITIATGGQLSDSSGFIIGSGAALIGSGKVTGSISGAGIVEAKGGTLELVSPLPASSGTIFDIFNSAVAALLLDSAPGTGNTFTFLGAKGQLDLADDTGFNDTISGLNVGTGGAKTNFIDIEGHTVTISSQTGNGTTSGTITLSDGAVLHLTNLSSSTWYAHTIGDGSGGTDVFVSDSPFQSAASGLSTFSYSQGWTSEDQYPRTLGDVNGDGKADIVGFGYNGVWVSLATGGGGFAAPVKELGSFSYTAGWTSQDQYPREVADVNGDGMADIVGFGYGGVYVSLATGGGNFAAPIKELGSFSYIAGWTSDNQYPRELADVNGDGLADIVGFGYAGVYVSLATGGGSFAAPTNELGTFSYAAGWTSQDKYPRFLADVNGDGMADIVGFGYGAVYVSLATGGGHFAPAVKTLGTFSYANGWTSQDQYPRELADVNGDGMADIVGFGSQGVWVAHGKSDGTFGTPTFDFNDLGFSNAAGGWTSDNKYPRAVGDVTGDGKADLVGFGYAGVSVAISSDVSPAAAAAASKSLFSSS